MSESFPGGNNPFVCDMVVDGKPCPNHASLLYRTRHATKVVCDTCASELRMAKGRLVPTPIVEFALLELMPAREALLRERDAALDDADVARLSVREAEARWGKEHTLHGVWIVSCGAIGLGEWCLSMLGGHYAMATGLIVATNLPALIYGIAARWVR
jgi:hypothetical protein